jgi:hypothetical protein
LAYSSTHWKAKNTVAPPQLTRHLSIVICSGEARLTLHLLQEPSQRSSSATALNHRNISLLSAQDLPSLPSHPDVSHLHWS